ncbi:outer membrane beta-barrel protein [Sporomusa malonica]|uniref:Outer membrane protein beta-barrel domain-containing protein n=1 Tax=Sporomusa malonica TaxID=112901 RepID=A0A1W1ZPR8_9FIRM|nr:outer membrane beta-barrel protein [Sporomusa malonica]SMC50545.1 Outer membrane protein beta-barrel domain-containing protein [Sporomusa malonica]
MKKSVLVFVFLFALSTVCAASPLMDYSQGKTAVDINFKPNLDVKADSPFGNLSGKNSNVDFGLTVGLGNNWAVQYRNGTADSKVTDPGSPINIELVAQQINVFYKLNKNVAGFVGYTHAKPSLNISIGPITQTINAEQTSGYQVGLVGFSEIGKNTNAYGEVATGNKITHYQVGIAYEFVKNLELNIAYQYTKYKGIDFSSVFPFSDFDYTAKGMSYGITYKF